MFPPDGFNRLLVLLVCKVGKEVLTASLTVTFIVVLDDELLLIMLLFVCNPLAMSCVVVVKIYTRSLQNVKIIDSKKLRVTF